MTESINDFQAFYLKVSQDPNLTYLTEDYPELIACFRVMTLFTINFQQQIFTEYREPHRKTHVPDTPSRRERCKIRCFLYRTHTHLLDNEAYRHARTPQRRSKSSRS